MKQLKNYILIIFILISFIFMKNINIVNAVNSTQINSNTDINIDDVKTSSPSCLLMDAKTGQILYAKNAYEKMYPASTTKLMTAILVLENCKLDDIATVSHNAIFSIPAGYSHASLKEGEKLTIEQLLNVLLIPSANDAAIVLAEHVSGSVKEFSTLMNKKAKELGCLNTNFVNPNGIHEKQHISTAYDLALIGKYAMKFPDIMRISKVKQYTLPATNKYNKADRVFELTNALVQEDPKNKNYYQYATGLKTGYTDSSGSCIVATATKEDRDLIVVILNGNSINSRYNDCRNLFEYGFNNYEYKTIKAKNEIIKTIQIVNETNGLNEDIETKNLDIAVKDRISLWVKKDIDIDKLEANIEIKSDLKWPISKNTVVGTISYNINGTIYSSDLIAASSVYSSNFEVLIFRGLLLFLILYIIYRLLKHHYDNSSPTDDFNNTNKESDKSKSKKNNKSLKIAEDSENINNEKGRIKFTQISEYLE